ncbi:MAG: DUF1552 domain-containing protein [Myxococcota bacterium]
MISRRMFLRGATGASLAIPFLPSMVAKGQAGGTPLRYVQWATTHGQYDDRFFPSDAMLRDVGDGVRAGRLSDLGGSISSVLRPFDRIRDRISVLGGLDVLHQRNNHNASAPTCGSTNWGRDGDSACDSHNCVPFGHSVDAVLEDHMRASGLPVRRSALRLTPGSSVSGKWGSFCWRDGERIRDGFDSTRGAMSAVFSGESAESVQQFDVVDRVVDDYRRVRDSGRIGRRDQQRLDQYLTLLSEVQSGRGRGGTMMSCAAPPQQEERNYLAEHQNAVDIATAALACGATTVVAYHVVQGVSESGDMESDGVKHHSWAHQPADKDKHAYMQQVRYSLFARFVENLHGMEDADGNTVLYNSLLYASTELSKPGHGSGHLQHMPLVVAGEAGGRMRTGEYVHFGGRPINNFLVGIFDAFGLQPSDYERGRVGFGDYDGRDSGRYSAYTGSDAAKRRPVSYLFRP